MPNSIKKSYVDDLVGRLANNESFVVVGFEGTKHTRFEELRTKLREMAPEKDKRPSLIVLKNSLFQIALKQISAKKSLVAEDVASFAGGVKGKSGLLFLPDEWMEGLKAFDTFAKEEEGMVFRVGVIDGKVYVQDGLNALAKLPSREQLVAQIIGTLRAPQSRLVYGLTYTMSKLVNVLKNAGDKKKEESN